MRSRASVLRVCLVLQAARPTSPCTQALPVTHRRLLRTHFSPRPHFRDRNRFTSTSISRRSFCYSSKSQSAFRATSMEALTAELGGLGVSNLPSFPNSYPDLNPVDIYRSHLAEVLAPIIGVDATIVFTTLHFTAALDRGDLQLAVPALRIKGRKPDDVAAEIQQKFPEDPLVEPPIASGGFVQFRYKPLPLAQLVLPSILQKGTTFGTNPENGLKDVNDPSKGRKRIIVEFSSPNIAKPFHAGHLRSTIIGGFLSNLYESAGWDVVRINYLGDWGKQYGILALGYERFGDENALKENAIGHLYDVYVKINVLIKEEEDKIKALREGAEAAKAKGEDATSLEAEAQKLADGSIDEQARKFFKRMVDGDEEALATWRRFRDLSIVKCKETYSRLNIEYDEYSGESQVSEAQMDAAEKLLGDAGLLEENQGATIVDLAKHQKKLGKAIVRKRDGTSLYLTRDIGEIFKRYDKYAFDKMIYVVAAQQDLHFAQLFKIIELMGRKDIASRCQHINFGMVLGMSTRKGTAKFLDDILRDVAEKMHEVMKGNQSKYVQVEDPEKTADTLGISSVMVQDQTGKRVNNYNFDMNRMTSFEGDTGPYLQYAHARLSSIIRKAEIPESALADADLSLLSERHSIDLVRALAQWPGVLQQTLRTLEPVTVLVYLFKMTHALSSSYDHLQVVGSEQKLKTARLALYTAARQVLYNGMRLLGLSPVKRM